MNGGCINIQRLPAHRFTYELWKNGTLADLGIFARYASIKENKGFLRKIIIGYCPANIFQFRPRGSGQIAVMLWHPSTDTFWTHISEAEFEELFP